MSKVLFATWPLGTLVFSNLVPSYLVMRIYFSALEPYWFWLWSLTTLLLGLIFFFNVNENQLEMAIFDRKIILSNGILHICKTHFQRQTKKLFQDLTQYIDGNSWKISIAMLKPFRVHHNLSDFIAFTQVEDKQKDCLDLGIKEIIIKLSIFLV